MKKFITGITLTAFLYQSLYITFFWMTLQTSAPVYANDQSFASAKDVGGLAIGRFTTPSYNPNTGQTQIGDTTLDQSEMFGSEIGDVAERGDFTAAGSYQNEDRFRDDQRGMADRIASSDNPEGNERDSDVAAYNTLLDSKGNRQKLKSDDMIMQDTQAVLSDLANDMNNPDNDFFKGCVTETNTRTVTREYVGKRKFQCIEPDRSNLNECEVKRHIEVPLRKTGGSGSVDRITNSQFRLTVGDPAFKLYGNHCKVYKHFVEFQLSKDVEIERVVLRNLVFDDSFQVSIGNSVIFQDAFTRGDYDSTGFPIDDSLPGGGNCERSTVWRPTPNTNHTAQLNAELKSSSDRKVRFGYKLGVSDLGFGHAVLDVYTKNSIAPREFIEQDDPGCAAAIGYAQPQASCKTWQSPGHKDYINPQCGATANQYGNSYVCTYSGWDCIEQDNTLEGWLNVPEVSSWPIAYDPKDGPNVGKTCVRANLTGYDCKPLGDLTVCGRPNWPESDEIVCGKFEDINKQIPDQCELYREDDNCRLIDSEPAITDPQSGRPFSRESTYECDIYTDTTDYTVTEEENVCTGDMACVGGDCQFGDDEVNSDFGLAMGVFSMLDDIERNMTCDNPDEPETCRIFEGEANYCGIEQTGMGMNCCTLTAGKTNVFDYVKLVVYSAKMETVSAEVFGYDSYVKGGWDTAYEAVSSTDTYQYVAEGFSNMWDSVVGNTTGAVTNDAVAEAGKEMVTNGLLDEIKQEVYSQVSEFVGEEISKILFQETGTNATGQAVLQIRPEITGALNAVMWAYMAYQLTKLALTMLSECDDDEMGMGIKIDQQQCIKTGSSCFKDTPFGCFIERDYYCCYPSPLGRIIMEQVAPQLGRRLDAEAGRCEGISLAEATSEVDWNAIDLTEWIDMMAGAGVMKTPEDMTMEGLTFDPTMSNLEHRQTPDELSQSRFEDGNLQEAYEESHNNAIPENTDCSVYPRPPVCDSPIETLEGEIEKQ
ncbi:conjugal transfer protein TraN [Enterovibrio norvegicus]|uniref:conjugal transfer protein TraN n=1 Tax=Enterovibrio norvegicus TaxID=188144 RepID=UPI00352DFF6D